jgi:hypothetical protein
MLVVFPTSHNETKRTADLFAWIAELDSDSGSLKGHRALLVASSMVPKEDVRIFLAQLTGLFYAAEAIQQRENIETGWPGHANALFQLAAAYVVKSNLGHWFWCETDCIPVQPEWLDSLDIEYRHGKKPFMGTIYNHPFPHINGCAVYPQSIASANPFMLNQTFKLPWDLARPDVTLRQAFNTPLIQRELAEPRSNTPMTFPDGESMRSIKTTAVVFHGCKDGTLIARLRELRRASPRIIPRMVKKTFIMVVLPFCNKDLSLAIGLLEWIAELSGGVPHPRTILLSYEEGTASLDQVRQLAKRAFKEVKETSYSTPAPGQMPHTIAFRHAANVIYKQFKQSFFWMEPDVTPLVPEWLTKFEDRYHQCRDPFMGVIVPRKGHMNGTGVYPPNAVEYIPKALKATWTAWDTSMRREIHGLIHDCGDVLQHVWGMHNDKFHPFLGEAPDFSHGAFLDQINPGALMLHRCKNGSLIKQLREKRKQFTIIEDAPVKTSWLMGTLPGCEILNSKVEIFIVSYLKDLDYLKYCLRSIQKFARGFSGLTILVPSVESEAFQWMGALGFNVRHYKAPEDRNYWHLAHQLQKCRADEWCPNADWILHMDSDCIFTEPVTPQDYFVGGRAVLLYRHYSQLKDTPWQATVETALKHPAPYLTMIRHPSVYHRDLYPFTRRLITEAHEKNFDDYVMSCKPSFPWGFSEFSTMGTVAMRPEFRDSYHFIDVGREGRPKDKLTQFWSLSPIDKPQNLPSVGGTVVPMDIIRKVLA